jgi:hypothetical protein
VAIKINCRYFVNAVGITKKDGETIEVPDGMTAARFLDYMTETYGPGFEALAWARGEQAGEPFKRPDVYLNKKRLQWAADFPDGLQTVLRDGDEFWFGLMFSGG